MGVDFIAFPNLGIRINVSPVAFELGSLQVRWYGIIISLAILAALSLALRQTKKFNIKDDDLIDMFLIALPVSIIFARLFYVVFKWDSFKNDFLGIFRIWEGGLAIYGAVIGAVLSVYIFSRRKKMDMLHLCDFACVYLPLAQAIGRWGNFFNQELYGTNTNLPWGMTGSIIQTFPAPGVNGDLPVHPTFLYESLWNLLVFAVLLKLRNNYKVKGTVFASYLMLYSVGRFLTEMLRTDEFGVGSIRYNQVFAAFVFAGALTWYLILARRARVAAETAEDAGPSAYADILDEMAKEDEAIRVSQKNAEDPAAGNSDASSGWNPPDDSPDNNPDEAGEKEQE